jgi:signal peptidase I
MQEPRQFDASASDAPPSSSLRHELRGWTRDLLIALALLMAILIYLYRPVRIEGTSMAPLLSDQERIFINEFVYHFGPIDRGDVVVFWYPLDRTKSFIKRVVGLPGDLLEIRQGSLFINGHRLQEPYVPARFLDGSSYGPVIVPPEEYFVLGDHRDSSNDSRVFGPVPQQCIYGKAVFAYWPVSRLGVIPAYASNTK